MAGLQLEYQQKQEREEEPEEETETGATATGFEQTPLDLDNLDQLSKLQDLEQKHEAELEEMAIQMDTELARMQKECEQKVKEAQ